MQIDVRMKSMFFDRAEVIRKVDALTRKTLSRAGAFVRQRARSSIRKAPAETLSSMSPEQLERWRRRAAIAKHYGKPAPPKPRRVSAPGQPPYSHTGDLRKILFAYDSPRQSVVIGPVKLNKSGSAPEVLEYGGNGVQARPYMGPALWKEIDAGTIPAGYRGGL